MSLYKDLVGQKFNKLTVLERVGTKIVSGNKNALWRCKCECGNEVEVISSYLKGGNTKSCGCIVKERMSKMTSKGINKFEATEDTVKIFLQTGNICIIDTEDYEKIQNIYWFEKQGYVCGWDKNAKKHVFIHNIITGEKKIDHINNNPLDNRKANLRKYSKNSQNCINRPKSLLKRKPHSIYKGVTKHRNNYEAIITKDRKRYFIGSFKDEIEAAKAYDKKAKELFGEFAHLNFPEEN